MSISANQPRLTVQVGGVGYAVVCLSGVETFNRPFVFQLEIVSSDPSSLTSHLNSSAMIAMLTADGVVRRVYGLITEVGHLLTLPDQRQLWKISVSSNLYRLTLGGDTRLLLNMSLPDIVQSLCGRHGLDNHHLVCDWRQNYPLRTMTLQAGESDFDCLARLCSRNGILFWSAASADDEVLHFADSSSVCRPLARPALRYRPAAGLERDWNGNDVLHMTFGAKLVSDRYAVYDVAEERPDQTLLSERDMPGQGRSGYGTTLNEFGAGMTSLDAARERASLLAQIGTSRQVQLSLDTHAADLSVGRVVNINAEAFGRGVSGDYLIIEISHQLRQYAGLGLGGENDCPYRNQVRLVPREMPYRVPMTPLPKLPLTFSARIETRDPTAQLDEDGRTRYRQHNDSHIKPFALNSSFTRRMQPYGGTGSGYQPGWHMPLQDGAEILLSCLNSDPDRPMIVGVLPNPENRSPATSANPQQNIIRTACGQKLVFDDTIDEPVITMKTFAGHNMLHLNAAKAEHLIRLASDQGLAEIYAKQTIQNQCGDSLTEIVGNNRNLVVENTHETITNQGEIHHQAATDATLSAGNNLQLEAGQNLEFETGQDMIIDIREAARLKVGGCSAAINLDGGSMLLQADGDITIQGDGGGDIVIGQNGGGIRMDPAGNITLFGKAVDFQGAVTLSGRVNMDIDSPPSVSLPCGVAASAVHGIDPLESVESTTTEDTQRLALKIDLIDIFGGDNDLRAQLAPLYEGVPCVVTTDRGEVYTSQVKDYKIEIADFDVRQRFQLRINGLYVETQHGNDENND